MVTGDSFAFRHPVVVHYMIIDDNQQSHRQCSSEGGGGSNRLLAVSTAPQDTEYTREILIIRKIKCPIINLGRGI